MNCRNRRSLLVTSRSHRVACRSRLPVVVLALLLAACGSQEKVCAPDQVLSSGACLSIQTDPKNCGAPGNACAAGQGCSGGACVDCTQNPGACTTTVVAACSNLNQVRPLAADLTTSGPPFDNDLASPIKFATLSGKLYVANSTSSSISTITLPAGTSVVPPIAIPSSAGYGDLEHLAAHGGYLWASNAASNTLVVVDPATGTVKDELALPPGPFGANPQGIDFVGTNAYLALNGLDSVAVLDVSKVPGISLLRTIDVSQFAPSGASAMPGRVAAVGTKVYVALWGLDPTFAPPAGAHGYLAVIDTATDTATARIDLGTGCLNPGGMALDGKVLWVGCGFHAFDSAEVKGAAIMQVDLSGSTPLLARPVGPLTNAIGSVAFCGGRGYAGATESGTMLSFDPATSTVLQTSTVCPAPQGKASYVSDVTCAP